jgi:hypothetical protein
MKTCDCGEAQENTNVTFDGGEWVLEVNSGEYEVRIDFCPFCGRALLPDVTCGPDPAKLREALDHIYVLLYRMRNGMVSGKVKDYLRLAEDEARTALAAGGGETDE